MPILARIQAADVSATKNVFISAFHFATSTGGPCPPFEDELKTSAREQVEFMLGVDMDMPLVMAEDEVKSTVRMGLSSTFASFEEDVDMLLVKFVPVTEASEDMIFQSLADVDWMCNILPKVDLMKEFVSCWAELSSKLVRVVEDAKLEFTMWGLKVKLIEITGKVLEAVGYGNVILPAPCRVLLLKTWLPYIRKMKPLLDAKAGEEEGFSHKMDDNLCESVEGAIVSLLLALPSRDQADILSDWIKEVEQVRYPDLSEAFEVWCYRSKSAKRRLMEGLDRTEDTAISL